MIRGNALFVLAAGIAWWAGSVSAAEPGPLARYDPPLTPELRALLQTADAEAGARTFDRKCSTCHDGARDGGNSKGPHLWNVVGRKAGTHAGFSYSEAMKGSGHVWSYATLDYFLSDTARAVPRKAMDLVGIPDARTRADLIAYLRTLNDVPPALP